jgi:type II secretory pathway predicted ATPase ExeA/pSer/pThr/pTyr-binding forkhead associated (FHA) protein
MELRAAGLQEQPFRSHGRPLVFVGNAAQEAAYDFFNHTYQHFGGLGLFQGPTLSGKTTIIRHFAELQGTRSAVAVVDGAGQNTTNFLEAMLSQFGFEHKFSSVNELINMVKVYILQQTASGKPPMLIVENTHAMNPSAMRVLCELATERVREKFALKIVLASDRSIAHLMEAPAMENMSKRLSGDFHLAPLTADETADYLYAKMRSGGCFDPENVFPDEVCDELHAASGGWPGIVDRLALLALAKAEYCPVSKQHIERPAVPASTREVSPGATDQPDTKDEAPVLYLTKDGRTLKKIVFNGARLLVGRSEHNDLCIDSTFISRHHALFVRNGKATLLMDLNSSNGTFVNSRRVSNQVMINDDVITIGHHGIKFVDPRATDRAAMEGDGFHDTMVMKSLEDMRRILARENTTMLPAVDKEAAAAGDTDKR